jgi:hypothetical protein
MTPKNEFELVVHSGNRSWPERILAAVFFAIAIFVTLGIVVSFFLGKVTEHVWLDAARASKTVFYCFAGGVVFSMTKTVMIDVDANKSISRFAVGPFSRDRISKVPQLEYVAVFLDQKGNYQVNLWYGRNKHYKMYRFQEKPFAMKLAAAVAQKLHIDLLDATRKGDFQWVENIADHV